MQVRDHEGSLDQGRALCRLRPRLHGIWTRPGVQFAGRPIRCRVSLYKESGSCRLDPEAGFSCALRPRIALKHRRQRNVQSLADLEKAPRADAVLSSFVFLNLLE